jgi:hypothetical protein
MILLYCDEEVHSWNTGPSSFTVLAKVQWAPFEEEFGEIRSNLNRYTSKLGRLTAAITMNTALDIKEELKKTSSTHARTFAMNAHLNNITTC